MADPILVDKEFGTGAVKITPAHDFNDFEAGERHGLKPLAILDFRARMSPLGLQEAEVEDPTLQDGPQSPIRPGSSGHCRRSPGKAGLLLQVEDHAMAIGKCYRCKTVVEPYLSPQWFVNIQSLAIPAIQAVETGQIRIIPEGWKNNYLGWMRQIKDWCISRQIWWGHQIPAWYCRTCNKDNLLETGHAVGTTTEGDPFPKTIQLSCFIPSEANPS